MQDYLTPQRTHATRASFPKEQFFNMDVPIATYPQAMTKRLRFFSAAMAGITLDKSPLTERSR
jgi:hypothetical protein